MTIACERIIDVATAKPLSRHQKRYEVVRIVHRRNSVWMCICRRMSPFTKELGMNSKASLTPLDGEWQFGRWSIVDTSKCRRIQMSRRNSVLAKKNPNSDGKHPDVNAVIGVVIGRKG